MFSEPQRAAAARTADKYIARDGSCPMAQLTAAAVRPRADVAEAGASQEWRDYMEVLESNIKASHIARAHRTAGPLSRPSDGRPPSLSKTKTRDVDIAARLEILNKENDALRERVAMLEGVLFAADAVVPLHWGMTANERRVFGVLLSRELATRDAVMAALYSGRADDAPDRRVLDVVILRMRRKLKRFGVEIETQWGKGWRLPDAIRSKFKEA